MPKVRADIVFATNPAGPNANKSPYIANGSSNTQYGFASGAQMSTSGTYVEIAAQGGYLMRLDIVANSSNVVQDYWTTSDYVGSTPAQGWIEIDDSEGVRLFTVLSGNGSLITGQSAGNIIRMNLWLTAPKWQ